MRKPTSLLLLGALTGAAAIACGGAKTPGDTSPLAASSAPAIDTSVPSAPDAGPATTTDALGDAGTGQKLAVVDAGTSGSASGDAGRAGSFPPDPGRSAKDIEVIVKGKREDARKCYDEGLKAHPGIEGDLVVTWIVDPDGNVKKIDLNTARSTITEPSIVACVIEVIKKIKFATSPRGMESTYNYPFNFHPRGGR
jgi:hypothetical protein